MAQVKMPAVDTLALYQVYADYVRHENDLLNHRTTWFVAIETVLVAGAAYLLLRYFESAIALVLGRPDEKLPHIIEFIIAGLALCGFGLVAALAARRSIKAAIASQCALDATWRRLIADGLRGADNLPDLMGGKCAEPADGQHFADRLVDTILFFWKMCLVALIALLLVLLL